MATQTKSKSKSKSKPATAKPECQIKSDRACNGQIVRKYKGTRKGDPVFYCCIGCTTDLQRAGVKFSPVN